MSASVPDRAFVASPSSRFPSRPEASIPCAGLTKDQEHILLTCKFSEIPTLFPDHDMDEMRAKRMAMQKTRAHGNHRRRVWTAGDALLDPRHDERRWRQMCIDGNAKYEAALKRAGA
jgi:hypothetical protein